MTTVLRHLLAQQPASAAKVSCAWRLAAGRTIERAAACEWTADGTLLVRARDAAWRREIERARPVIAERLRQLLGDGVVRHIVVSDPASPARKE